MESRDFHDYVIKDGILIGDWDGAYRVSHDPWNQTAEQQIYDSRRVIAKTWAKRINDSSETQARIIEVGCGFGHLTNGLRSTGLHSLGIDISPLAIEKARNLYPRDNFEVGHFNDWSIYQKFQPDIFLLSEITWYVLDELSSWLQALYDYSSRKRPTYLIHLLATYPEGVQKYGLEYFHNLETILSYFDLRYLEYGEITTTLKDNHNNESVSIGTFFIAKL